MTEQIKRQQQQIESLQQRKPVQRQQKIQSLQQQTPFQQTEITQLRRQLQVTEVEDSVNRVHLHKYVVTCDIKACVLPIFRICLS